MHLARLTFAFLPMYAHPHMNKPVCLSFSHVSFREKVVHNVLDALLNGAFVALDMNFRILRGFVRSRHASKFLDA